MDNNEFLVSQGYTKVDFEISIGTMQEVPQLDPDLMFVKFIMCHEGVNANGDTFTKEVLSKAQFTPKYKPIDWEHGQPMIGHILESEYKENPKGVAYIEATGLIWKFIYPELSSQIKSKSATGELRLSMECYYRDANYKVGDQIYDNEQAEKLGIIPYVGREYMGSKVTRVFKEVIFGGVGVVANPADKQAVFLAVAKDLGIEKEEASDITRTVNDFTNKQHSNESHGALAVAKYVKAFDKAKSSVVAKFNAKTLKTKEQVVAEVNNTIKTLLSEVTSISSSYYRGIASKNDESNLFDKVQLVFENTIASNNEFEEAYLVAVENEHILYDVINYSNDSVETMTASLTVNDGEVEIDFANATKLAKREETEVMANELENVVADEVEVVAETVVAEEAVATNDEQLNEMLSDEQKSDAETSASEKDSEDTEEKSGETEKSKAEDGSDYQELINKLEASLAEANDKVAKFEARFAEMEAEKLVASRLADLQETGISFSGSRLEKEQAKLRVMSEEAYVDYKDLLAEVAGKKMEVKADDEEEAEEKEEAEAEASTDIVQENEATEEAEASVDEEETSVATEITVEEIKTSVLNVETPIVKSKSPFGHLTRR